MRVTKRKKYSGSLGGDIAIFLLLFLVGLFMLFPIYLSVVQSLKPIEEFFIFPPKMYPINPTDQNFTDLMYVVENMWVPFTRYVFNSALVALSITGCQLLFGCSAAYALSKCVFPGRKALNRIIELALLFTSSVMYIMQYMVMSQIGIIDTYLALILPAAASPMTLFLMRQFMGQLPDSMIEAAKLDGASQFKICWQVVMPNVKPAWITLIIFAFTEGWKVTGYSFIYDEALKTIPTLLTQIGLGGIARSGVAAAAVVILMIPPMVLFVFCQSNVMETMAHSGLKE